MYASLLESFFSFSYFLQKQELQGSNFLAANLYAKSVFGEDALVNVSVEKKEDSDGKLSGYIRIRSKTQGIALSLGDRITAVQRLSNSPNETAKNESTPATAAAVEVL
jgi:hypothetical protein